MFRQELIALQTHSTWEKDVEKGSLGGRAELVSGLLSVVVQY